MLELKAAILFVAGLLNLIIGLLVYLREPSSFKNRLFFILALSLCGWVFGIGSFLLVDTPAVAAIWAKIYYAFPLTLAATMPLFVYKFPVEEKIPLLLRRISIYGLLVLLIPLIVVPNFVTAGVVYHDWGKEIVLNKAHYFLYSGYLLGLLAAGLVHIYRKSNRLTGRLRHQARAFFWGFTITASLGALFNLIYPWFGNYRLIWLGPLFTSAFVVATGYSIVRYKMFDIKSYVVRAAAYLLSLTVVSIIYIAPVLYVVDKLIPGPDMPPSIFILVLVAMSVAAALYGNIRQIFDKATNALFFRGAYNPERFIAELNQAVVSTLDLETLLSDATRVIGNNTRSEYCLIGVKETAHTTRRIIGTQKKTVNQKDIELIRRLSPHTQSRVIVTDALGSEHHDLVRVLRRNNIALLARLVKDVNHEHERLGYIILGPKKNGTTYTSQDVRIMETVINGLIVAIQNSLRFEEIQNFNITLQQRVDEATAQLRRTNIKLEALDETKDDFISMASHQLRTPLTAVKGYLSIVLDGDAGKVSALQRKMLNQAFMSSERMVFLIADLLNVSRLKTGKFVIEKTDVNLADLISQEIGQLRETATSHSLELTYDAPKDFPILKLDETKTRQVVMNFIDNAIHYTPAGGHVHVELLDKSQTVELRVRDDGIGVPKAEQHHLFTKFYRAVNARRERPDGTGLGLFMAKKVVLAQGGAVIFDSHEKKGSTFGFTLPKAKLLSAAPKP